MAWKTLGIKTNVVSGTAVQFTTTSTKAHAVLVQAHPANTGIVVVGTSSAVNATTLENHTLFWLPKPSLDPADAVPISAPSSSGGIPIEPNSLDLSSFWFDAKVTGDKIIVSYQEG